uniref:Adenosylmethionine decarboxylase n=2 Tax=Timema TaxID=61471 RepID=A0A7R9AW98_TIMSH|nr:unnamed protein product [Timema shepardi]CAD7572588.1 unnamed protein product [Timema californicum]
MDVWKSSATIYLDEEFLTKKHNESSMFITQHRFILKTCGTTTPLQCLQPLLLLVEQYAGFDDVKVGVACIGLLTGI